MHAWTYTHWALSCIIVEHERPKTADSHGFVRILFAFSGTFSKFTLPEGHCVCPEIPVAHTLGHPTTNQKGKILHRNALRHVKEAKRAGRQHTTGCCIGERHSSSYIQQHHGWHTHGLKKKGKRSAAEVGVSGGEHNQQDNGCRSYLRRFAEVCGDCSPLLRPSTSPPNKQI